MKKRLIQKWLLMFFLGLSLSCEQTNLPEKPPAPPLPQSPDQYESYLDYAVTQNLDAIPLAVSAYKMAFGNATTEACDQGFAQFLEFQVDFERRLNQLIAENPKFYYSLNERSTADSSALIIANKLKEMGFLFIFDEGFPLVVNDPVYLRTHFYEFFSPVMKQYFDQFELERAAPFAADGAILIPISAIGKRLIFWEHFSDANQQFPLMEEVALNYSYYLMVFLLGMDNTPAFDRNTQRLKPEFRKAHQNVIRTYPESSSASVLKSYRDLLIKNGWRQTTEVEAFVQQFVVF